MTDLVDRPYATAEQYERRFMADCARCGRRRHKAGSWPDGHVCRTCLDRAVAIRGVCPGCQQERALPGRRPGDGIAICTTCAGFSQSFACSRCGFEGKLHAGRRCTRCTLGDQLDVLLDDGTGRVRPVLIPLRDALLAMDNPRSGLGWLSHRRGQPGSTEDLLRRLGRGEIALTHEAFHILQPWRAAAHLRELLMSCGVLPAVDKHVCSFEQWLTTYLPDVADPDHARVLRQFATWQVLPWLRRRAARAPLGPGTRNHAGGQVRRAEEFLRWLSDHDSALRSCTQADLDRWHVEHRGHEWHVLRPFLRWAMRTQHMPRLHIPRHQIQRRSPISQQQRLTLIRRVLTDDTIALRTRVAAALTLLYAQPLTRIVRLTTSDILLEDEHVLLLRLGTPPTPVPAPLDGLLLQLRDHRTNMRTATNPDSPWLFPGRRAGQPLRPDTLGLALRGLGLPATPGRTAALRQLVLQAPAPVVADMLGFHPNHTTRVVAEAGGTWSRYAPEDHHPG